MVRVFAGRLKSLGHGRKRPDLRVSAPNTCSTVSLDIRDQEIQVVGENNGEDDVLFTEMVMLWHIERQCWTQVSAKGGVWSIPDALYSTPACKLKGKGENVLVDGCLLYSRGTTYLFKSGTNGGNNNRNSGARFDEWMDGLVCPVTLEKVPTQTMHVPLEGCICSSSCSSPFSVTARISSIFAVNGFLRKTWKKIMRKRVRERFLGRPWVFSDCGWVFVLLDILLY